MKIIAFALVLFSFIFSSCENCEFKGERNRNALLVVVGPNGEQDTRNVTTHEDGTATYGEFANGDCGTIKQVIYN